MYCTCFLCFVPFGLVGCCYFSWPCSPDVAWSVPKGEEGKHIVWGQFCIISTGKVELAERLISLMCKILTLTPPSWFFGRGPPDRPTWSGLHSKYQEKTHLMKEALNWKRSFLSYTTFFMNLLVYNCFNSTGRTHNETLVCTTSGVMKE